MGDIAEEHLERLIFEGPRLPRSRFTRLNSLGRCMYCGETVSWRQTAAGMRPFTGTEQHDCQRDPNREFGDLT